MASPKTISAKPEAELVPRPGDQILNSEELSQLDLFGSLKKKISVEKFPGSIVLRHFRRGEIICRQGDRGNSAFYIARADDIRKLPRLQSTHQPDQSPRTADASRSSRSPASDAGSSPVATAYLFTARAPKVRRGWWSGLAAGRQREAAGVRPEYIPNDGPNDIDYDTRQAPMFEGDVFGEMSCMTLAPRSATVVAQADCYMVEFQRNIFDQMQKDTGYRERVDRLYEERVLTNHLRRLDLFRDLDDAALTELRAAARLEVVEPGTVICNEGDPSDDVYLIRSGVVQVVHGAHVAFQVADVSDWAAFCRALMAEVAPAASGAATEGAAQPAAAPAPSPPATSVADILAAAQAAKAAMPTDPPTDAKSSSAAPAASPSRKRPAPRTGGNPLDVLAAARAAAGKPSPPVESTAAPTKVAAEAAATSTPSPPPPTDANPAQPADQAADSSRLLQTMPPAPCGNPRRTVWNWLQPHVQRAVVSLAEGSGDAEKQALVIGALNALVRTRDVVAAPDLADTLAAPPVADAVKDFPRGPQGAKSAWSDLEIRVAGEQILRTLYPQVLRRRSAGGPLKILDYMARGDCFGELGVVLRQPRQATCVAYDHPADDANRKPGRVELVRIRGEAFRRILETHPHIRSQIERMMVERRQNIARAEQLPPWDFARGLTETREFRDQGLIQGQKLLLIDLDRCTRCGDCVRACVNTHNDGYSRLFLDGPRFDRFLVPSACRQCLNPVCMIGCPVGSIQRGENGQIEIRDWCIGCGLCARQCPYDSIQMHDLGIIPLHAVGWRVAPRSVAPSDDWQALRFNDRGWAVHASPFHWTLDLFQSLAAQSRQEGWRNEHGFLPEPLRFRYAFDVPAEHTDHAQFRLFVKSEGLSAEIWLNGAVVEVEQDARQKKNGEYEAVLDRQRLLRRGNVLAVQLTPADTTGGVPYLPKYHQLVLSARLDPVPQVGELTALTGGQAHLEVELVTERAVVCDLCSSLPGQQPACVTNCPHDAAMRINARTEFPAA